MEGELCLGRVCWRSICLVESIKASSPGLKYLLWAQAPVRVLDTQDELTCQFLIPESRSRYTKHLVIPIIFCASSRGFLSDVKNLSPYLNSLFIALAIVFLYPSLFLSRSGKDGIQYSRGIHINDLYNNISSSLLLLQKIRFTSVRTTFPFFHSHMDASKSSCNQVRQVSFSLP